MLLSVSCTPNPNRHTLRPNQINHRRPISVGTLFLAVDAVAACTIYINHLCSHYIWLCAHDDCDCDRCQLLDQVFLCIESMGGNGKNKKKRKKSNKERKYSVKWSQGCELVNGGRLNTNRIV